METNPTNGMLRKGAWLLCFWFLFNTLPGIASLVHILLGKHAPAFQYLFQAEELASFDGRLIATVDGLAIIANSLIIAFCILSFFIVRKVVLRGEKWAFYLLSANIVLIQVASYWSDAQFSGKNFWIVNFSSVVFLIGIGLCAAGLAKRNP